MFSNNQRKSSQMDEHSPTLDMQHPVYPQIVIERDYSNVIHHPIYLNLVRDLTRQCIDELIELTWIKPEYFTYCVERFEQQIIPFIERLGDEYVQGIEMLHLKEVIRKFLCDNIGSELISFNPCITFKNDLYTHVVNCAIVTPILLQSKSEIIILNAVHANIDKERLIDFIRIKYQHRVFNISDILYNCYMFLKE